MPANMCIETKGMNPKFNRKYTKGKKKPSQKKGERKTCTSPSIETKNP